MHVHALHWSDAGAYWGQARQRADRVSAISFETNGWRPNIHSLNTR